jgi:hypothetical protein
VVLSLSVYFLIIKKSSGTLNEKEEAFAIDDTSAIGKIFIADMKGKSVVLQRSKDTWIVNNKYEVRNDIIKTLISTLKRVKVSYPVPHSAEKTVVTNLASNNKKVEIYDRNGELMKSYLVGGGTLDSRGTYMLMDGAKNTFVTAIPGFQGVLDTRYVTDEQVIRSTAIFRFRINEISSVSVKYADQPDSSFTITVLGPDSFALQNGSGLKANSKILNHERLQNYLRLFESINCEGYQNDLPKKDTILQTIPFCTVTANNRAGKKHEVVCYRMPANSTSEEFDAKGNKLKYDVDRYFASINGGSDFVIVQNFHFGRLLKGFNYFLSREKSAV